MGDEACTGRAGNLGIRTIGGQEYAARCVRSKTVCDFLLIICFRTCLIRGPVHRPPAAGVSTAPAEGKCLARQDGDVSGPVPRDTSATHVSKGIAPFWLGWLYA